MLETVERNYQMTVIVTLVCLKDGANEETLLQKQNCVQEAKNASGKFQRHFLLSRGSFYVFSICCEEVQTKEHRENTEETLSPMFPECFSVCVAMQHTLKKRYSLHLGSKKCFAFFPFAHPCNALSNIDSNCFYSTVFSFGPALSLRQRILKVFQGSMPPAPLEKLKNLSLPCRCWRFLSGPGGGES